MGGHIEAPRYEVMSISGGDCEKMRKLSVI